MKIEAMDKLATELVGDNGSPNLFFVSVDRQGTVLVSREFEIAYQAWRNVSGVNVADPYQNAYLEDRQYGVIASAQKIGSKGWEIIDDSSEVRKVVVQRHRKIVEAGGGEYVPGMFGNLVLFNSLETGSTLALPESDLTSENVRQHILESNKVFGK